MARAKNSGYQVHDSGDHTTLDGIFRLISLGEREEALEDVLTAMCGDIATIARADVASVYVREEGPDGERFTMRGNVGFPPEALGRVHLGRGEGITGFAADRLRPVSVADADRDARFKYIPGLGEEQFPALLAVPVLRGGAAAGVLVLQRRAATAFTAGRGGAGHRAGGRAQPRARAWRRARAAARRRRRPADGAADRRDDRRRGGDGPRRGAADPGGAGQERDARPSPPSRHQSGIDLEPRCAVGQPGVVTGAGGARDRLAGGDPRGRALPRPAGGGLRHSHAAEGALRAGARLRPRPVQRRRRATTATAEWLGARAAEIEDLCVLVHAGASVRPARMGDRWSARAPSWPASGWGSSRPPTRSRPACRLSWSTAMSPPTAARRPWCAPPACRCWRRSAASTPGCARTISWWSTPTPGVVRINPPATTVARFRNDSR